MDFPPLDQLLDTLWKSEDNRSYMKKYLTTELARKLSSRKTASGCDLASIVVSGVEIPSCLIGLFVPDTDAYDTFWELLEPVVYSLHKMAPSASYQPPRHMTGIGDVTMDPDGKYILSTRVRLARNLMGHGLPPISSERELRDTEDLIVKYLSSLSGDLSGSYLSMETLSEEQHKKLHQDHLIFNVDEDIYLVHGRVYRHWPAGRGIFMTADHSFLVWVNEEDHLRIITMATGGHIGKIYDKIIKAEQELSRMEFARNDRVGYLTFCPSNLGTTLRASVHIRLPLLSALPCFRALCDSLQLDIRGTGGEHTETKDGIYDISNKQRLGLTEDEAVKTMVRGVDILVYMEKRLGEETEGTIR